MANILQGVNNFLTFINDNWTLIVVLIGLVIGLYKKVKSYLSISTYEKVNIAKKHIEEIMLNFITDAEEEYQDWVKAGSIKRSQVIKEIFTQYPILNKVTNQEDLIKWIDSVIDNALVTLRDINKSKKENNVE